VRSALAGAADVNGDGRVEYSELKAFIAAANLRVDDPRARIQLFAQAPARDRSAPLADLSRRSELSYLMLPSEMAGRFHIEDERGIRRLDLHKEKDRALAIALPAGHSYFLRSIDQEAEFAPKAGQIVDAAQLEFREKAIASRGSVEESFRDHLFETPFGPKFYGGFVSTSGEAPVAPLWADLTP
jgi:hypothetical protein